VNIKILSPLIIALAVFSPSLSASVRHKPKDVIAVRMGNPDGGMVTVSCKVSGIERWYVCVIDSGATHTIISDRVLKAEGPLVDLATGNGVIQVHEREVSLMIGDDLVLKSNAFIEPNMVPQNVDIFLGQDVLRQFRAVVFDYDKQQVEFYR